MRAMKMLLCAAVVMPVAAHAHEGSPAGDLLRDAGLHGRWAIDCSRPPGAMNPTLSYVVPADGPPVERHQADTGDSRETQLLDVTRRPDGRVQWVIAEGEVMLTIVTDLRGDRLRTWSSSTTDGHRYITRGRDAAGKPVPWFRRCKAP